VLLKEALEDDEPNIPINVKGYTELIRTESLREEPAIVSR
jgi:hypothetical protein